MGGLIKTDLGLVSKENANWLYKQGIIARDGCLRFNLVDGMIEKKVQMYSYFRWVVDDIKEKIPTAPKQVRLDTEDMVTLMREGVLRKPYFAGKEEFHYMAKYPAVESLYNTGRKVCLEHQGETKGGKKREFIDFDD